MALLLSSRVRQLFHNRAPANHSNAKKINYSPSIPCLEMVFTRISRLTIYDRYQRFAKYDIPYISLENPFD